tara:strand:- start:93 stop:398 length:306 start_codon:yes stop_codon:yes gene_type:complete
MFKKFLLLIIFTFLTNCSAPGSAFLGPVFTGAKTGSIYQASLSYSGNQILHNFAGISDLKLNKIINSTNFDEFGQSEPIILTNFAVAKIEVSEVFEPEPLP